MLGRAGLGQDGKDETFLDVGCWTTMGEKRSPVRFTEERYLYLRARFLEPLSCGLCEFFGPMFNHLWPVLFCY